MKRFLFFIFFGVIISVRPIMAQNDTLLLYDFFYKNFKTEKFILYVDIKTLNDSSKIYTLFSPCSWYDLISTIPLKFYRVKKKALICFFYGNEDFLRIEENYMMKYLDTLKIYFDEDDEFKLISWEKKQLKRIKGTGICDPPIFSLIIKNCRIIQESCTKNRLYPENYIHYNFDNNY